MPIPPSRLQVEVGATCFIKRVRHALTEQYLAATILFGRSRGSRNAASSGETHLACGLHSPPQL